MENIVRKKLVEKQQQSLRLRYSALPSFEIFCSSEWMWVKLHRAHQQSAIILLHKAELHQMSAPVGGFICMQIEADWPVHVCDEELRALLAWLLARPYIYSLLLLLLCSFIWTLRGLPKEWQSATVLVSCRSASPPNHLGCCVEAVHPLPPPHFLEGGGGGREKKEGCVGCKTWSAESSKQRERAVVVVSGFKHPRSHAGQTVNMHKYAVRHQTQAGLWNVL